MPIDDLARSDVVTAAPDASVSELAAMMDEENVGSIVIIDDDAPVGIVTDRDLTVRVLADGTDAEQTAAEIMTEDPCTIERDDGFYEATDLMAEHGVRRLPVSDGDQLVGIITADDLTELIADEEQQLADVIRAQRPEY
ncbi:putative signal transduction protein with CBS domains [Natrinema pellirubrum DSM 15624]|uniref:Putative signal transduction protein with CBS domains n=1 Tax=Natrinema pellirubrum (strain DSM 15624 / CIP 106293 / JCM 10476 / NCIMB 786 / 157) TaxID=797303 RepID=L0JJA4_NATP1|nr:CBS domain-containing protein [Natrinema pellirubrum]AGB31364.1 putative signal-transduction protein containing cAMP-binding and CBS domains [Natrinema pellirubrum DSM 15624]ELY81700.1 putative signal transduction protein with CBS domains [Natrinema pellirubrum DSM 15624]